MQTIQLLTMPDLPGFVLDLRRIREPGFLPGPWFVAASSTDR